MDHTECTRLANAVVSHTLCICDFLDDIVFNVALRFVRPEFLRVAIVVFILVMVIVDVRPDLAPRVASVLNLTALIWPWMRWIAFSTAALDCGSRWQILNGALPNFKVCG